MRVFMTIAAAGAFFATTAIAAVSGLALATSAIAVAAERPSFEMKSFPISPVQVAIVGSADSMCRTTVYGFHAGFARADRRAHAASPDGRQQRQRHALNLCAAYRSNGRRKGSGSEAAPFAIPRASTGVRPKVQGKRPAATGVTAE